MRKKKSEVSAVRLSGVVKILSICVLLASAGMGYVWQKQQIYRLGQEMKQRETTLEELRSRREQLGRELSVMQSPTAVDARVRSMKLSVGPPQPNQIVRLVERWPSPASRREEELYAGELGGMVKRE